MISWDRQAPPLYVLSSSLSPVAADADEVWGMSNMLTPATVLEQARDEGLTSGGRVHDRRGLLW